jgi:hypothetical protein
MPYGLKHCGCCGATEDVEAHHLYLRKHDCPDNLAVWLYFGRHWPGTRDESVRHAF